METRPKPRTESFGADEIRAAAWTVRTDPPHYEIHTQLHIVRRHTRNKEYKVGRKIKLWS